MPRETLGAKGLLSRRRLPPLECQESLRHPKTESETTTGHHRTDPELGPSLRLVFGLGLVLHGYSDGIEQRSHLDSSAGGLPWRISGLLGRVIGVDAHILIRKITSPGFGPTRAITHLETKTNAVIFEISPFNASLQVRRGGGSVKHHGLA